MPPTTRRTPIRSKGHHPPSNSYRSHKTVSSKRSATQRLLGSESTQSRNRQRSHSQRRAASRRRPRGMLNPNKIISHIHMPTVSEIVEKTANELYPGTSFALELKQSAENLLAAELAKVSRKALRKAILTYRPPTSAATAQPGSKSPSASAAPSAIQASSASRGATI